MPNDLYPNVTSVPTLFGQGSERQVFQVARLEEWLTRLSEEIASLKSSQVRQGMSDRSADERQLHEQLASCREVLTEYDKVVDALRAENAELKDATTWRAEPSRMIDS
jgi:hypothetical protein